MNNFRITIKAASMKELQIRIASNVRNGFFVVRQGTTPRGYLNQWNLYWAIMEKSNEKSERMG